MPTYVTRPLLNLAGIILSLLCFLLTTTASAQTATLVGRVIDPADEMPLSGATISILGLSLGAATEDDGTYRIEAIPAGQHTVRFSFVGYAPLDTTLVFANNAVVRLDVALSESEIALGSVTVQGNREAAAVRESPFSVAVLDAQRLAGRGLTADEAIARVSGVQVRRSGGLGSASVFSIRGLEGERIQVYINGNAADISGNAFSLDNLPLQIIERVEVYKGIVPAIFGGDGLGSAINVVTIHPEGGYIDAGYTVGSFGQHQVALVGQRPIARNTELAATLNVDWAENDYIMDNPFRPGLVVRRDHDRLRRLLGGLALHLHQTWFDEIAIEAGVVLTEREIQGVQTNIQHARVSSGLGVVVMEAVRDGALDGRLALRTGLVGGVTNAALLDTSAVRYEWDGATRPSPNGRGEIGFFPSDSDNRTFLVRWRGATTYRFSDRHALSASWFLDRTAFRPSNPLANDFAGRNVSDNPGDQASAVVGFSHEWKMFGGRLTNIIGTRGYAYWSEGTPSSLFNPSTSEPELIKNQTVTAGASEAIRYRFTPSILGKASVELAHRLPSTAELFGDGLLILAAPNLKPERAVNLNLGVQIDTNFGGRRLQAEVSTFWSRLSDMIRLGPGLGGTAAYSNLGTVRIAGVEAEIQGDVTNWFFVRAYGTYQDARDVLATTPGTSVPNPTYDLRIPNLPYLYGGLSAEVYRNDLFSKGSRAKLFYESLFTEEYFFAFEVSQRQERRIPRALTHNVGGEIAWLNQGITISAEVQNLTDADILNLFNQPLPGRALRLKLRYTLIGNR